MAYEKQTFEDGQVLKAAHLNHMEDGIEEANKAIVSVSGDTLTWDGNTEGLVSILDSLYKISDAIVTADDLSGGGLFFARGITSGFLLGVEEFDIDKVSEIFPGVLTADGTGFFMFVSESAVGVELEGGIVFPEAGVYAMHSQETGMFGATIVIFGYTGFVKKQVNPEYLPGAVTLYVDSENYLCTSSGIRMTIGELRQVFRSGCTAWVLQSSDKIESLYQITAYVFDVEFGHVEATTSGDPIVAFTAEYGD